jgi:dipeptidyl aminopeptidase/acylaminoacyl peptidase
MRITITIILYFIFFNFWGQNKKPITHESYNEWKYLSDKSISSQGNIITSKLVSYRGNDSLLIHKKANINIPIRIGRATNAQIDFNEKFVVFNLVNDYDSIRKLKIDKVNKKKWTKDSLGIYALEKDTLYKIPQVAKYQIGKEGGGWILVMRDESYKIKKKEELVKKNCFLFKKKSEPTKLTDKSIGSVLTVFYTDSWTKNDIENVSDYSISNFGNKYAYVQTNTFKDTLDSAQLFVYEASNLQNIFSIEGEITQPTFSKSGDQIAFKTSSDTGEYKKYQLYLYDFNKKELHLVLDTIGGILKDYQSVDSDSKISFSDNGQRMFYNIGIKPIQPPKDTLTDDEKYQLDIWSWTDGRIQPQQLLGAKKDAKGLIEVVFDIETQKNIPLCDTNLQSLSFSNQKNEDFVLMRDQLPYLKEMTWDFWYFDIYSVNIKTGEKQKILEKLHGWSAYLSPNGKHLVYFESLDSSWYHKNSETNIAKNITQNIDEKFYKMHHDVAQKIGPEGRAYWVEGEDVIAIESQHDIWFFPLVENGIPYRYTKGKEANITYSLLKIEEEMDFLSFQNGIYMKGIDNKTMSENITLVKENIKEGTFKKNLEISYIEIIEKKKLIEKDAKFLQVSKAKKSDDVIFQYMTFDKSPELYLTNALFENEIQLTNSNPQQSQYNWCTVEIINWVDYNGDSISGLLYKPEDFDASKKYPMIAYFYERYTDRLHTYYRPKPTASIIYAPEYASNGYVVFIPDIKYKIGKPAQGAYDAIMSGTDYLVRNFNFIDSTRMGLQGQSWGGYQTAQLITMTTRYKCAMAGAPVSNMFSAYGGIRWGSGLARTFQYETGQSRIGKTIWEAPELYIENSPLFHLPKVQTPLLIMHNDADGAVPWYQGIELYNGLRRLQKPTWMFNYNGDDHNLMKDANRLDLSIRMKQFFDYYLQDKPIPEWMEQGIPATEKGKKDGY